MTSDRSGVAWSQDGTRIAAASWSGLRVWNPRTNQDVLKIEVGHDFVADGAEMQVAFSPHGLFLAASDLPGDREPTGYVARVLDRDGLDVVKLASTDDVGVVGLAWSCDGTRLAAARMGGLTPMYLRDFGVDVWEVSTGELLTTLPTEAVAVAPHPDPDLLVTGGRTGAIEVWNVHDQAVVGTCDVVGRAGRDALVVSPAGDLVAAGNDVGRLDVWDLATGRHLLQLPTGSSSPILDVAFSPDGRHVFAGQVTAGVRAWTLDHDELLEIAEARRSRDFTPEERRRILGEDGPAFGAPEGGPPGS